MFIFPLLVLYVLIEVIKLFKELYLHSEGLLKNSCFEDQGKSAKQTSHDIWPYPINTAPPH